MKTALYMLNCYLKEFEGIVEEVKDGKFIFLDHTAFYPTGGGQLFDTGKLIMDHDAYNVVNVSKVDGRIMHEVDRPGLKVGEKVHGIIDWERRYKHMRMHTAAHVLANIIEKRTGALITGNQLSADRSRVDFNLENFDREAFKKYEEEVNEFIRHGRAVNWYLLPRKEAEEKASRMTTLAKGFPEHITDVRLVEIEGLVIEACGGTHLKNVNEIKGIRITSIDNKGKSNRRVYFELLG
jgi:misacylated tRNA(Ala) deacylase